LTIVCNYEPLKHFHCLITVCQLAPREGQVGPRPEVLGGGRWGTYLSSYLEIA